MLVDSTHDKPTDKIMPLLEGYYGSVAVPWQTVPGWWLSWWLPWRLWWLEGTFKQNPSGAQTKCLCSFLGRHELLSTHMQEAHGVRGPAMAVFKEEKIHVKVLKNTDYIKPKTQRYPPLVPTPLPARWVESTNARKANLHVAVVKRLRRMGAHDLKQKVASKVVPTATATVSSAQESTQRVPLAYITQRLDESPKKTLDERLEQLSLTTPEPRKLLYHVPPPPPQGASSAPMKKYIISHCKR